ncbi:Tol-Pal system beta propeller repeat protein TolB [Candidatus Binatus sp.]|uniref:Tol-Pal system beta propeller repeat protein TolB n=1 Tax=Candidatus Binatus sp. TaxID=2811406 RepID=UPI003C8A7AD8
MKLVIRASALIGAIVFALALAGSAASAAPIIINITGPGGQVSPIAVSGLKNLGGDDNHRVGNAFVSTLRRDLELSGYFRLLDPHAYIEDPQTSGFELGQFNFADWRSINADFLVKGSVNASGGPVKLTAYLYDVAQQRRMMGKSYSGDAGDVTRMARRFADAILEAATGEKGPFDSKLAFVSTGGGRAKEVYTQSIDGQDLVKLTSNPTINLFPSFDRTTNHLLYLSYKSFEPALYLVDLKAQTEMKITSPHGRVIGGTLSPDGEQIAAAIERGGITNLYLLTRDGAEIRQLTDTSGINVSPAFSPDGAKLAFTSDRSGTPQIYVMTVSGGSPKRVTYSGDYNTTPAFSPKGDKLAYQSRTNGRFDIFTIPIEGGDPTQVTDGNGSNEYPSWSPDGRYLAFSSTRAHNSRIYIMLVGNRKIISALTEGIGNDSCPAWSGWLGE